MVALRAEAYCIGWDKDWPGYKPDYYSVAEESQRAEFIVEVRSRKETWLGEEGKPAPLKPPFQNGAKRPWGFDPYVGAYYDVEVLRTYKGNPPRRLRLFSENSTARFHLWVGKTYLLFLTEASWPGDNNLYTVDTCGNSGDLGRSGKVRKELRKIFGAPK